MKTQVTGAKIVHDFLTQHGISQIFGIPGADVLPIFDQIYTSKKISLTLTRHEQAAVHAADGYFRSCGKIAGVIGTSGPGSTNQITGIAAANADSIPLLAITLNTDRKHLGKGAFQEVDIVTIAAPITKYAARVKHAKKITSVFSRALKTAYTQPYGPVLVDIPKDVLLEKVSPARRDFKVVDIIVENEPQKRLIYEAIKFISKAKQPVILAGDGVISSQAEKILRSTTTKHNLPIATTVSAVGVFPEDHSLSLQAAGVLGTPYANSALQNADVLVAIGTSLEPRTTGNSDDFAKNAKIIHVDPNQSQCGLFINPFLCVNTGIKNFLSKLYQTPANNRRPWLDRIESWKKACPITFKDSKIKIKPQRVIQTLHQLAPNSIIFAGNGQHKYWTMRYFTFTKPRQFNVNSRFGCMGFAFPASIGAKLASSQKPIITIAGDGDFQMNLQELATAVENKLDLKIIIINNQTLGAVHQHQHISYNKRFIGSYFDHDLNFAQVASAYGARGLRITKPSQIKLGLKKMLNSKGVFLLEVIISKNEHLLPKISASESLDNAACLIDFDTDTAQPIG